MISAVETDGGTVVYQETDYYDVYGQQVEQDVAQSGTTTVTKFVYGPNANIVADLNSVNAVIAERVYLNAMDSVFARMYTTGMDFYLTDHVGSVRGLENTSGSLDDAITYDPWGNQTSQSNPSAGDWYGFASGDWDSNVGLYHFGVRQYNPAVGRWTAQDPLGLAVDHDPYRYVDNSPANFVDLTGLKILPRGWPQGPPPPMPVVPIIPIPGFGGMPIVGGLPAMPGLPVFPAGPPRPAGWPAGWPWPWPVGLPWPWNPNWGNPNNFLPPRIPPAIPGGGGGLS